MGKSLAAIAIASTIAVVAGVTAASAANSRSRNSALVYGYGSYCAPRFSSYYRPHARRRAYEYDHHYGLNLYGR
jgi:hypothetical protein